MSDPGPIMSALYRACEMAAGQVADRDLARQAAQISGGPEGVFIARDLIFSGRLIDAEEALTLGLVNVVVDHESLVERTRKMALELAGAAPTSIRYAKEGIARSEQASLDEILDYEEEAQLTCFRSEDALEGLRAFGEKRRPDFKGK